MSGHPHPTAPKGIERQTAPFAKESRGRSWLAVVSGLGLLALALAGTLPIWGWPFRIASAALAALMIVRVFVIYHDHQHRAILARSKAADLLMRGVGLFVLAPSSVWKHSHDTHHAHNSKLHGNELGAFPTMTIDRFRSSGRAERLRYRISRHPFTIFGGYFTSFLFAMCLQPFCEDPRRHRDGLYSLLLHAALLAALVLAFGWAAALLTLVAPFLLAGAMGSYLFYAQHNFPQVTLQEEDGWTFEGAALESSSFMRMPRILHWFTGNIGYHHIHHLNARIPFYRLPEAYRAIPALQSARTTSLHPGEILRCLRLKLWSVEKARLVGWQELRD